MKPKEISMIEASIYVEYIQNHIIDSFSKFHQKCVKEIEHTSSEIYYNASQKALQQMVNLQIVQPYTAFLDNLTNDINMQLSEYFGLNQGEVSIQPVEYSIYDYNLNYNLIEEYTKTKKLSELMEKLISKTINFTCLDHIQTPIIKNIISSLSVGSIFMSFFGLDSNAHKAALKQELCNVLKGIGKNINVRYKTLFLKQYSFLIYQIMEHIQKSSHMNKSFNSLIPLNK